MVFQLNLLIPVSLGRCQVNICLNNNLKSAKQHKRLKIIETIRKMNGRKLPHYVIALKNVLKS